MNEWISVEDELPNAGDKIIYVKWIGWCNPQDEFIHVLLHKKPSKPETKCGEVLETGNEGYGNYIRIQGESPDQIPCWMPLPNPPEIKSIIKE